VIKATILNLMAALFTR